MKASGRWRAQIVVNGKNWHIGVFATPKQAAQAYDKFARAHGISTNLNFPNSKGN
jgi:hypothetical protein